VSTSVSYRKEDVTVQWSGVPSVQSPAQHGAALTTARKTAECRMTQAEAPGGVETPCFQEQEASVVGEMDSMTAQWAREAPALPCPTALRTLLDLHLAAAHSRVKAVVGAEMVSHHACP
jgi:hypothetical protein